MQRSARPETTLRRALLSLALIVVSISLLGAISTATSWPDAPEISKPHGALETLAAFVSVLTLWLVNVSLIFAFVVVPTWTALHLIGARSWWIAPAAGFFVLFAITFWATTHFGFDSYHLQGDTLIDGKATRLNGAVTPYGWSWGLRQSASAGGLGAVVALLLWRLAYSKPRGT